MNQGMAARIKFLKKIAQEQTNEALKLQDKVNQALLVNLLNRNWGTVGFHNLVVLEPEPDVFSLEMDLAIPFKSPPFVNTNQYPGGLNQFKQEVMNLVNDLMKKVDFLSKGANLSQVIKVNGK